MKSIITMVPAIIALCACQEALPQAPKPAASSASSAASHPTDVQAAVLKAHFAASPCMRAMRQKPDAAPPDEHFLRDAYTVQLSISSELMDHPTIESLIVRKSDHMAYLVVAGGFSDAATHFGPLDISSCLKP